MRAQCQVRLKTFLHEKLRSTRTSMGLTQSKMAELLMMDDRSYADLEHGHHLFGTISLLLFLIYVYPNPVDLLDEIKVLIEEVKNEDAL